MAIDVKTEEMKLFEVEYSFIPGFLRFPNYSGKFMYVARNEEEVKKNIVEDLRDKYPRPVKVCWCRPIEVVDGYKIKLEKIVEKHS